MSTLWPNVTRDHPCPICKKTDWCAIGETMVCCKRVPSERPAPKEGWYHPLDGHHPAPVVLPRPEPPRPNFTKIILQWQSNNDVMPLAEDLGVSMESLNALGACYADSFNAWAFPMFDGYGNIIGIRLRSSDGQKWAVKGSKQGIFMTTCAVPSCRKTEWVYLPEGPTSTAALLTMGLMAIGRPNNQCGGKDVATALHARAIGRAVIVADNDSKRHDDDSEWSPGLDGAMRFARDLGLKYVIWTPPTKDVRDFLHAGGTAKDIEDEVKNLIWRKPK